MNFETERERVYLNSPCVDVTRCSLNLHYRNGKKASRAISDFYRL